jgi:hypothetical protein
LLEPLGIQGSRAEVGWQRPKGDRSLPIRVLQYLFCLFVLGQTLLKHLAVNRVLGYEHFIVCRPICKVHFVDAFNADWL